LNTQEIYLKIDELKMEYVKVQGDIEKLESTGHSTEILEAKLSELENKLREYRSKL
jgi:hypothetical protein